MLQDLLASVLLARETLQLFGAEPPSLFDFRSVLPSHPTAASKNEPDLKAKAAVAYADRTSCIFDRERTVQNYDVAIRSAVYAVQVSASASSVVRALALDVMGVIYELKWQKDRILGDLADSIDASRLALDLCAQDNEHWPVITGNYAGHLELRFNETHDPDDIATAITLSTQVYERAAGGYDRSRTAANLSAKYQVRAKQSTVSRAAREQDSDRSVGFMRIALRLTPRGHPERWLRLRKLSAALFARGKLRHHQEDLASAVTYARGALAAVPSLSAMRERLVTQLADVLELHYTETADLRMRNLGEINESIRWTREVKILY